jgi:hypothetical protein
MTAFAGRLELDSLTTLDWIGIVLALITATVHFVIGLRFIPGLGGFAFLLAAGGFVGAIVLLLVDYRRPLLYLIGIPYTGFQIVAWYAINRPAGPAAIGPATAIDKITQLALIVVLVLLYQWEA